MGGQFYPGFNKNALTKNLPLDQTLRLPCKFLNLAIFYHAKNKSKKFNI